MNQHQTVVIKMVGLTEDEIQHEFSEFFQKCINKYGDKVGFGLSGLEPNSELDLKILRLINL